MKMQSEPIMDVKIIERRVVENIAEDIKKEVSRIEGDNLSLREKYRKVIQAYPFAKLIEQFLAIEATKSGLPKKTDVTPEMVIYVRRKVAAYLAEMFKNKKIDTTQIRSASGKYKKVPSTLPIDTQSDVEFSQKVIVDEDGHKALYIEFPRKIRKGRKGKKNKKYANFQGKCAIGSQLTAKKMGKGHIIKCDDKGFRD